MQQLGEPTLLVKSEQASETILLKSRVLLREAYQRQGDNIITWCEPYYPQEMNPNKQAQQQPGVSFTMCLCECASAYAFRPLEQPRICLTFTSAFHYSYHHYRSTWHYRFKTMLAVWTFGVKLLPCNLVRPNGFAKATTRHNATDMAHAVAAAHHASLQRQEQHAMWEHVASEAPGSTHNHRRGRQCRSGGGQYGGRRCGSLWQ